MSLAHPTRMKPEETVDIVTLLQNFGLPVALLVVTGWAIWQVLAFMAHKVVEPIVTRTVKLIDQLDASLASVTDHLKEQTETLRQIRELHNETWEHTKLALETIENRLSRKICHYEDENGLSSHHSIKERKPS